MVFLPFPPLSPCRIQGRRNRFLVETDRGPLHLRNTGRLGELLKPGTLGYYWPRPTPKAQGRLLLVERDGVLVGVDAPLAQEVLRCLLEAGAFGPLEALRTEAPWMGERLDFWARLGGREVLLEAKNANRLEGHLALFPDAPTLRGARQARALAQWAREGGEAYIVWLVQHPRAQALALDPGDALLLKALGEAQAAGVGLRAYRLGVGLEGVWVEGEIPVFIPQSGPGRPPSGPRKG